MFINKFKFKRKHFKAGTEHKRLTGSYYYWLPENRIDRIKEDALNFIDWNTYFKDYEYYQDLNVSQKNIYVYTTKLNDTYLTQ